jgi:PAS domain S-box-containing protein
MKSLDPQSLDPGKTVLVYAVGATLVVSLANLIFMMLGLDDGSTYDFVGGFAFVVATSALLWLLLVRKRLRLAALQTQAGIQQALASQSTDVLMLEDDTGLIVAVNQRAEQLYGRPAAELIGTHVDELRTPEARSRVAEARIGLAADATSTLQCEQMTAAGRRFPVEEAARVVEIDGRRYVHNSVRDLSESVRSRDLLRMFHDLPFLGMAVIDADGDTIENVNDEFCRMLGWSRAEFGRRRWLELFETGEVDEVRELQRRLASGEIERVLTETRQRRADGAVVEVMLDMRCTRRSDGAPDLFLAMVRDVTLRNRTFRELQQAHRHLRSITDASDSFIWLCDAESRCLLMNEKLARVIGGRPRDFVGRPRSEFIPAANVAEHEQNDRRVFESGEPLTVEERFGSGDEQRCTLSVKFPVRDASGRIYAVGGIATDVTDLRAAEEVVAESERKYRLLFESNPNPMWLYEVESLRILAVNEAALVKYGYSRAEFLSMTIADLRSPEDRAALREMLKRIGDAYDESGPWRHRRKDGSHLLVNIISHVVHFEGRRARLVLPIDITQRLAAESAAREAAEKLMQLNQELERRVAIRTEELSRAKDRAEAADRVKSVFLASMSHELRTPLSSVIGFSELLLSQADGPLNDKQRHQIEIVQDAGRHLLGLISDVLDISRIEAGALSLRVDDVDLAAVLRDEAELVRQAARDRGLDFVVRGCEEVAWVRADARRTRQVAANLLSNAIKFTDAGSVTLSLEREEHAVRVTVEDTGIGIARAHLGTIFEPFRRVESPEVAARDGTGLGLSIVLRLLEAMGGHLGVESEPGRGSRFWFTLPAPARAREHASTPATSAIYAVH